MNEKINALLEYNQKQASFLSSETYYFYRFLNHNRLNISILRGNYFDLIKIYKEHNDHDLNSRLWDKINPKYRQRFQKEIIRCISNYLNSLFALIDYSRKNIVPYLKRNPDIYKLYCLSKSKFEEKADCHKFLIDLRNFTTHNTSLIISSVYSRNTSWKNDRKGIFINKEDILHWKEWKAESLDYLGQQSDKIFIMEIIEFHFEKFIELQNFGYLCIFLVDQSKLLEYQREITSFYEVSLSFQKVNLLYSDGYIKYISKMINLAQNYLSKHSALAQE